MMTHDTLWQMLRQLPHAEREQFKTVERARIREQLTLKRYAVASPSKGALRITHHLMNIYVPWDDPEFIALCAIWIAERATVYQARVNRLASG